MKRNDFRSNRSIFRYIITGILILAFLTLAYSVALSGMRYMYDADEVARVQESYLIASGYSPFKDYYTIYSPIFPFLMLPVFKLQGFTFAAIDTMRYIMTVLFFLRAALTAYLVHLLFGKRVAVIFAALFLLDPFTVFTSMQIRADNLMMLVLTLGIIGVIWGISPPSLRLRGVKEKSNVYIAAAGGLLVLSFCIMVKAFPTIAAVSLVTLAYTWKTKKGKLALSFIAGGCAVALVYLSVFVANGSLRDMIQQSVADPKAFQSTQDYPTQLGYFYHEGNWNIFGAGGRSLPWMLVWVLPVLGFAGAYQGVIGFLGDKLSFAKAMVGKGDKGEKIIIPALAVALVLQWGLLFSLHTVLMQYYIPILWLFAVFGAYAIDRLLEALDKFPVWQHVAIASLIVLFLYAARVGYKANLVRSGMGSGDYVVLMNRIWQQIPEGSKVFPMVLFRPPGFPLADGYFAGVHSGLLERYNPVEWYLERDRVPYVMLGDYILGYLKPKTREYIRTHYKTIDGSLGLMARESIK